MHLFARGVTDISEIIPQIKCARTSKPGHGSQNAIILPVSVFVNELCALIRIVDIK